MKKTFDAVAWMRARREAFDREDAGRTPEQRREAIEAELANESAWLRLLIQPAVLPTVSDATPSRSAR